MSTQFGIVMATIMALLAGTMMMAAHYLAPRVKGDDVQPPVTYIYGTLFGIMVPFGLWHWLWSIFVAEPLAAWIPVVVLCAIVVGAGLGTLISYGLDWLHGLRMRHDYQ